MEVSKSQQLRVLEITARILKAGYMKAELIADVIHCAFQYEDLVDLLEDWNEADDPLMASALLAELQSEVGNILLLENATGPEDNDWVQQ